MFIPIQAMVERFSRNSIGKDNKNFTLHAPSINILNKQLLSLSLSNHDNILKLPQTKNKFRPFNLTALKHNPLTFLHKLKTPNLRKFHKLYFLMFLALNNDRQALKNSQTIRTDQKFHMQRY